MNGYGKRLAGTFREKCEIIAGQMIVAIEPERGDGGEEETVGMLEGGANGGVGGDVCQKSEVLCEELYGEGGCRGEAVKMEGVGRGGGGREGKETGEEPDEVIFEGGNVERIAVLGKRGGEELRVEERERWREGKVRGVFLRRFGRANVHEPLEGDGREMGGVDAKDETAVVLKKQGEEVELGVWVRSHDGDDQLRQWRRGCVNHRKRLGNDTTMKRGVEWYVGYTNLEPSFSPAKMKRSLE